MAGAADNNELAALFGGISWRLQHLDRGPRRRDFAAQQSDCHRQYSHAKTAPGIARQPAKDSANRADTDRRRRYSESRSAKTKARTTIGHGFLTVFNS